MNAKYVINDRCLNILNGFDPEEDLYPGAYEDDFDPSDGDPNVIDGIDESIYGYAGYAVN